MPLRGPSGGGGGGGGGLHFRKPADIFTGADLAACRTVRDAHFVAVATAATLADYQGNEFLSIVLDPADSTKNVFETYLPGNAGKAYARAQWVERTDAIAGNPGPKGDTGDAIDATARSLAGAATLAAAKASTDLTDEASTRATADTALGARITALPAGGGGGGSVVAGVPFSPTLIFTADDVDLPDNQTTVAITLTTAWDSFDAFYFSASLRDADAINNLILKEDFQRVGVKAAAGTNWYTGTKPQAIFVLDQNLASGGVSGMAICRIADTTMLLLARSFSSSSVNAQDVRIWGINYGGPGAKGDKGNKGAPGSGTADSTARNSIATEVTQRKQADTDEAIVRDEADVALGGRIDTETDAREDADTALGGRVDGTNTEVAAVKTTAEAALTETETDARVALATFSKLTDTPAAIVADKFVKSNAGGDALEYVDAPAIAGLSAEVTARKAGDATEVTARTEADAALGIRIDALAVSGSGGGLTETILFDGDVAGSSSNILRPLYQGASPAVVDEIIVPETGDLLFTVYPKTTNAFAGHFQIAAEDFITRTGVDGTASGQGQNTGFAFPVGQNRAFTVTHREVGGVKRFLWSTSHEANLTWHLEIVHLTPAPPSGPSYQPGPAHFRFVGLDRKAAVAAREKYFSGEVALSQAYVDIFSSKTSSYIRVTLDRSVTEQTGAAGNAWTLVLGVDHTNTAVSTTPNTPARTFTLRLPDAGITLDALAADLDGNSRLNAQVAGNGSALVDNAATWGSNPAVGSASQFRHGGDQSTIERTAWRAEYIANQNLVLVLAYGILEEYQHWAIAVAPAVSGWETVLTLIDPPAPNYMPGPIPNIFSGVDKAAAEAALDKYLDSVSGVTQAQIRIYSDADNYITVSIDAAVAKGPRGNKWQLQWGGDSDSAGEIELDTTDSLFRGVLKWDVDATTLAGLHAEFSGDSKFSSVVTGDDTSVVSVAETFGGDTVGNTIFFQGGGRIHIDTPHTWFAHYVENPAATITLEYESRQEVQVWDVPLSDFRTAFTLLDSLARPKPWTVLTHDDSDPEEWQWTLLVTTTEQELVQRLGGSVLVPTKGTIKAVVPPASNEVWIRLTKGGSDINMIKLDTLVLPDGRKAGRQAEFRLGPSGLNLRISNDGYIWVMRTTGTTGNVLIGCDIWYR